MDQASSARVTANSRRVRAWAVLTAVAAAAVLWSPTPVSACSGGMDFQWAIVHTRGWIAKATVVEAEYIPDGFYRITVGDVDPVQGRPPSLQQVTVAMGAVCDQSPDPGERILVLDGVAVQPPYDRPVVYVINGSDAIRANEVARVLRSLPLTDAAPAATSIPPRSWDAAPWLLAFGLVVASLALRQLAPTQADQVGPTGSRQEP